MFEDSYRHKGMRNALVKHLSKRGIEDERLLEAIGKVPRHIFFDEAFLEHAYQDKAFPIGEGQTISQPYTVALQTQMLKVQPGNKVLEVGTGSGYQCCVLLEMGAKVYTIEYNQKLYQEAKKILPKMGYHPLFFHGDGSRGLPKFAPFNKIIVTAGAPSVPKTLVEQLAIDGRLVIPVGSKNQQKMYVIHKEAKDKVTKKEVLYFSFVPLLGEKGWDK